MSNRGVSVESTTRYTVKFRRAQFGPWIDTGIDEPLEWRARHAWYRMAISDYWSVRLVTL